MEYESDKLSHQSTQSSPQKHASCESGEEHLPPRQEGTVGKSDTPEHPPGRSEETGTNARVLREVAQLTIKSFHSSQEAMSVALNVIGRFLDCQTLFIARFEEGETEGRVHAANNKSSDQLVLKVVETHNTGQYSPEVGAEEALNNTYCRTVYQTQQPLILDDVTRHPAYQHLAVTEKYHIGSYIGVPLIYSNGCPYGTLCSQDPHPRSLSEQPETLEMMQIIARFLISYIEHEELTLQVSAAEQAQADLARKEQQARAEADRRVHELEAIFETIGDGLVISDLQGQLQMNAAARHLLFMEEVQANVQSLIEKQSENTIIRDEFGHPIATEQLPIIRALRGEHLIGANIVTLQHGNTVRGLRYLSVSGMPIYDQQKQVKGAVCVLRDITEHHIQELQTQNTLTALLTLAESLAWVPDTVPEFFSATPTDQTASLQFACQQLSQLIVTLLQCQDIKIIALEPDNATWQWQTACGLVPTSASSWWQESMKMIEDTSSAISDTNQLRNNEIVMHTLEVHGEGEAALLVEVPMFVGNHLLGMLALIYRQHPVELTPAELVLAKAVAKLTGLVYERERLLREQAEARARTLALQEMNNRFNEFLSIASHELKGPLTAIKVSIQLAQRTLRRQEQETQSSMLTKLQHYLERMEYQVRVQDRLASDLIDVSRIRVSELELQKQPCDIVQIVREIVEDQRQITEDRIINIDLPAEKILIYGDMGRVGQVLSNYLTNALKYSAFQKPVEVAVTPDETGVRVTVSDQGPGLTPDEQTRVWERFYRVPGVQVLSGHGIGLGLGLHISKTIIESHGGRVGLQSAPGNGSHFWFTLPLSTDHSSG